MSVGAWMGWWVCEWMGGWQGGAGLLRLGFDISEMVQGERGGAWDGEILRGHLGQLWPHFGHHWGPASPCLELPASPSPALP